MTGLPVVSEKAVVAGIIYSALGSNGGGGNGTRLSTSVGTGVAGTTPSGTAGAGVSNVPTVIGSGGRAESDAVGLRKYSSVFVVVGALVVVGMVGVIG